MKPFRNQYDISETHPNTKCVHQVCIPTAKLGIKCRSKHETWGKNPPWGIPRD